jgi:hypothetical protein
MDAQSPWSNRLLHPEMLTCPQKLRFERSTFGPGYSETRGLVLLRLLWIRGANGTETQNFIVGIGSSEARASIHSDGAEATRRRGSL